MRSRGTVWIVLLTALGALAVARAAENRRRDERFGVMTHFAHGWDQALIPSVARSGAGTVRDELYWRIVESKKGEFEFPESYETAISGLRRHGIAPFIVLSFESDFYDGGNTPYTGEAITGYARYAAEILRHYGKDIRAVEVWNEYNGGFVRGPAEKDRVPTYLRTLRAVHEELKRERPDVTIVGGATAGVPLPYWEKLFAAGALNYLDVISVHPYRYDLPPEGLETDIAELAALAASHHGGKPVPIWVSEIGWEQRASQGPGDIEITEEVQAKYLVRAYALLLSAGVERVYWYLFRDYNGVKMGLARDEAGNSGKPAYAAFATMVNQLRHAPFVAREASAPDVYRLRFRGEAGGDIRVMWSLRPVRMRFGEENKVVDLWGNPLDVSDELTVGDAPIYVTGPLPATAPSVASEEIADARKGFSSRQEETGWSYGFRVGEEGAFTPLPKYGADDWRAAWYGDYAYLSLSAKEQHPSSAGSQPVQAVRRWRSGTADTVRVRGSFHGGRQGGDGVGVAVAVDGQRRFRTVLGGAQGAPVGEAFDFVLSVQAGTTIDFIVDPGPAANIDFDNTVVSVNITRELPPL